MDWQICEHLVIVRFGLTPSFAGFHFDKLRFNEFRNWFFPGIKDGEKIQLTGHVTASFTGTAKKLLLEVFKLRLQI